MYDPFFFLFAFRFSLSLLSSYTVKSPFTFIFMYSKESRLDIAAVLISSFLF
jgi:hypothetical protein